MVQHSSLTGSECHEPKGADTATADHVYVADGATSGSFQLLNPYGGFRYNDIAGGGTTYTTPTSYTLVGMATTTTNVSNFTHNSLGRLTYTGTPNRHIHGVVDLSFKFNTGSGSEAIFAIYKNGSILGTPNAEGQATAGNANYEHMAMHFDDMASTNDYYELYVKAASNNVIIDTYYMFLMGMPG